MPPVEKKRRSSKRFAEYEEKPVKGACAATTEENTPS